MMSAMQEVLLKSGISLSRTCQEKVRSATMQFLTSKGIGIDQAAEMAQNHYLPIFSYIEFLSDTIDDKTSPLIIGISAPQG